MPTPLLVGGPQTGAGVAAGYKAAGRAHFVPIERSDEHPDRLRDHRNGENARLTASLWPKGATQA